jgi:PAS domain S-box-containing protein
VFTKGRTVTANNKFNRPLQHISLVALAYILSGWASLLLAIPPGYTTALFLPIGIGLAAVLIWGKHSALGIFIGSSILNVSFSGLSDFNLGKLLIAMEIAAGSSCAALIGAEVIKRTIKFPNPLTDEKHIFIFLFLGGPVTAFISASAGVFCLWINQVIPTSYIFESWWTWWAGDTIGVLIAAPLMLAFFSEPRRLWRSRKKVVAIPVIISSLIVVAVFLRTSIEAQNKLSTAFQQQAMLMTASLQNNLNKSLQALTNLRALFLISTQIDNQKFTTYVTNMDIAQQGLSTISWNQLVTQNQRLNFEQKLRDEGFNNFKISEKTNAGKFKKAIKRAQYVPITYIAPWEQNKVVHGFDIGSEQYRRKTLETAIGSNKASMSTPIQLMQDTIETKSILIVLPVFNNTSPTTGELTEEKLQGFVTAAIRIPNFLQKSLDNFNRDYYELHILDITETSYPIEFYNNSGPLAPHAQDLIFTTTMEFGQRKLSISFIPTAIFIATHSSSHSWFVLAGGLLFTSLLGGFLLLISGRSEHVQNQVDLQTQELASILDSATESIFVCNEQGRVLRANRAAETMFSQNNQSLLLQNIYELMPLLQEHFVGNQKPLLSGQILTTNITTDFRKISVELSISRIELHDKLLFTFILHDITQRKKVDKLKSEFISTVSHELRTPLTSIKGALSLIQSGVLGEVKHEIKKLLDIAKSNADRLARLVNDILDIEKLEFGSLKLNLKRENIYLLLETAVIQNTQYAEKYTVGLKLYAEDPSATQAMANIDSDRFLQVMSNLISNAAKFSQANSQVNISLSTQEKTLTVTVKDTGVGIPIEFQQHIFQKFAQADATDKRKHEGTGLGLSITKAIIERFGGTISFNSQQDKGSSFYFVLPRD